MWEYKEGEKTIAGLIFGDSKGRWEDGHWIRSSLLKNLDIENGHALTLNSLYVLGERSNKCLRCYRGTVSDDNLSRRLGACVACQQKGIVSSKVSNE